MAKLSSFTFMTLNGYTHGPDGDISWHQHGREENQFAVDNMKAGNTLVFGRKTYELMAGYWPTSFAMENDPEVAKGMNSSQKIVFSNTLQKADWENTAIIKGDPIIGMKKLKEESDTDLTILGSGTLLINLADANLIDEFLIMMDPIAIGQGATLFRGLHKNLELQLMEVKSFESGVVLLRYLPV